MEVVFRAIIVYIWSIIVLRLMGKGLTFQQKPYDFVVMMLIGSTSASLIANRQVPLFNALVAVTALGIMHTLISISTLNNVLKGFIGGKPDIIVRNGRIVKENMIKNQINVEQLLSGLRNKGYRRIHDIEFAILEPNGQLSIIPKSQVRPAQPKDLQASTGYEGIPTPLIIEGKLVKENLESLGLDEAWLHTELSKRGLTRIEHVLLASLDTDGSLYLAEQPPIHVFKAFFMGEGDDQLQRTNPDYNELR